MLLDISHYHLIWIETLFSDMEKQLSNIEGNYLSRGHYRIYVVSPSAFENHFARNKTIALGLSRNVFVRGTSGWITFIFFNLLS